MRVPEEIALVTLIAIAYGVAATRFEGKLRRKQK